MKPPLNRDPNRDFNRDLNPDHNRNPTAPRNLLFAHEKLQVYADSIKFVGWAAEILERIPKTLSVADQLERASSSISLNISEGNGKFTSPDRCHFFDTARGSGLECAACLDVLVSKRITTGAEVIPGKEILRGSSRCSSA